jgi:hypothetical protein
MRFWSMLSAIVRAETAWSINRVWWVLWVSGGATLGEARARPCKSAVGERQPDYVSFRYHPPSLPPSRSSIHDLDSALGYVLVRSLFNF